MSTRVARIARLFCLASLMAVISKASAADLSKRCERGDFDCYGTQEAAVIAEYGKRVARAGKSLTITTARGKTVTLANEDKCGQNSTPFDFDHCITYVYLGLVNNGRSHLVLKGYYEGARYDLVDAASGRIDEIDDFPYFSPDGRHFALIGDAIGADWTFDRVQIWRWSSRRITMEFDWEYEGQSKWEYDFRSWHGNARVLMDAYRIDSDDKAVHTASIVVSEKSWSIMEPAR